MPGPEFRYKIPLLDGSRWELALKAGSSAVFVGANGSGKSRLGTYLELKTPYANSTHRVAAQRALRIPGLVQMGDSEAARQRLLYGDEKGKNKETLRWHKKPATFLLNDYEHVLIALFSEEFETLSQHKEKRAAQPTVRPRKSKLDVLRGIWDDVIATRRIKLKGASLYVQDPKRDREYPADEMSDGERVLFYLIGQCLLAPDNGVIIIDEPELHIHKSVLVALWDRIELVRSDCLFIYLTHDIEFAVSRTFGQRFAVRDYDGTCWDVVEIPHNEEVPDSVMTRILGSRKPILFVEGEGDSKDVSIFGKIYDHVNVLPVGSCEHVIHMTTSFNKKKSLHRLQCFGLVDRDGRNEKDVEKLKNKSVFTLDFAEIENILLAEDVLREVAKLLAFSADDAERVVNQVMDHAFRSAKQDADRIATEYTKRRLDSVLRTLGFQAKTFEKLKAEFEIELMRCDPRAIYEGRAAEIARVVDESDYRGLLALYDNKGMVKQIGGRFGLKSNEYPDFVLRHMNDDGGEVLRRKLRSLLPSIEVEPCAERYIEDVERGGVDSVPGPGNAS